MIDKFVVCRKEHVCDSCKKIIKKGQEAKYISWKAPKYKEHELDYMYDIQDGIEYVKLYICTECEEEVRRENDMYNFDDE